MNESIHGIQFSVYLNKNPPNVRGFKILLSSRVETNQFYKNDFNMDGIELTALPLQTAVGYKLYTLKILKSYHLGVTLIIFIMSHLIS